MRRDTPGAATGAPPRLPSRGQCQTIPGKKEWTVIINSNWKQHLTDEYDMKQDILRLPVVPETNEPHQERLRYVVESEGENTGEIVIYWENLEVSIEVSSL